MDQTPKSKTIDSAHMISLGDSSIHTENRAPVREEEQVMALVKKERKKGLEEKEKFHKWTLNQKPIKLILDDHLSVISHLENLFRVKVSQLGSTLPFDPPYDCIILPIATLLAGIPSLFPRDVC